METTKVLTVCEGNICRSPLAKFALDQMLRTRGNGTFSIDSAGLNALVGTDMDATAATMAERFGVIVGSHRAKHIREDLVSSSSLILTMTKRQRDAVASRFPRAMRRTFSLREFEKLTTTFPELLIEDLAVRRSSISLMSCDDIADPYRRSEAVHEEVASEIIDACNVVSRFLLQ